jgi:carboxyl-terminal processing protease
MRRHLTATAVAIGATALLLSACSTRIDVTTTTTSPAATSGASTTAPDDPGTYLNRAIDVIETNALLTESIDWDRVQQEADTLAADPAVTGAELHDFIRRILDDLGDRHSRFLDASAMTQLSAGSSNATPESSLREERIGYIALEAFRGELGIDDYMLHLHTEIADLDQRGACGWIVDLRHLDDGNMWPVLAGIGPLLGVPDSNPNAADPFVVGYSVTRDKGRSPWRYENGIGFLGEVPHTTAATPYRLTDPLAPLVVLTGPQTAGAGEALTVAFSGRPNTWTFGQPTYGVPTNLEVFPLSDGAGIALASTRFGDRTGDAYEPVGGLIPEQPGDEATATAWLLSQPACG